MRREVVIQQKLRSLDALSNVVRAMKSLAAHHLRSSKQSLSPARSYRSAVEAAVTKSGVALPSPGTSGTLLIAIGGDIGLCGAYNSRLAQLAFECRLEDPVGPTYCVGRRLSHMLERRNLLLARTYAAPASAAGISEVLLRMADDVLTSYLNRKLSAIVIVAAEFEGVGQFRPRRVSLLPIRTDTQAASEKVAPRYVAEDYFSNVAIRELLYIILFEQLLEGLASEHGARLVACQGAEQWLHTKRERLGRQLRRMRRETSTQETLETATAARLLRGGLLESVAPDR